jgi:hypothetical protein
LLLAKRTALNRLESKILRSLSNVLNLISDFSGLQISLLNSFNPIPDNDKIFAKINPTFSL